MAAQDAFEDLMTRLGFDATGLVVTEADPRTREMRVLLQDSARDIARVGEWPSLRVTVGGDCSRVGDSSIWQSPDIPSHAYKLAAYSAVTVTLGNAHFVSTDLTSTHSRELLALESVAEDYGRSFVLGSGVLPTTLSVSIIYDGPLTPRVAVTYFSLGAVRGEHEFNQVITAPTDTFRIPETLVVEDAYWRFKRTEGFAYEDLKAETDRKIDETLRAQLGI